MVMQNPGLLAFLIPQPVLQIATGATSRTRASSHTRFPASIPKEVYDDGAEADGAFMMEGAGKFSAGDAGRHFDRHVPANAAAEDQHPARPGRQLRHLADAHRNAAAQRLQPELRLPDQAADESVSGDSGKADQARSDPQNLELLYIKPTTAAHRAAQRRRQMEPTLGPQSVNHFNQFTSVTFNFNLMPGVPLGEATDFIEDKPPRDRAANHAGRLPGRGPHLPQHRRNLTVLMVLAVFVMYVILAILYESYLHPITVLSSLPVALVGGLGTLLICSARKRRFTRTSACSC